MPLADLEAFLTLRTCLSGYCMDTADIIVWAALRTNHVAISLIKKSYSNILRWYSYIEQSNPWILNTVDGVIEPPAKARAAASSTGANYNIDLPDIDGPMVTRFPPEPSGYLHIGHGKAAMLNDYFAHQTPGGTLICRFDDTNPSKESMEFQNAIVHDLQLMGWFQIKLHFPVTTFSSCMITLFSSSKMARRLPTTQCLGKGTRVEKTVSPQRAET